MPHIAITMIPGRDDETKQALALKTQAFLVGELGIDPKFVFVSIQDIPKAEWAKPMEQFSDEIMFQPGFPVGSQRRERKRECRINSPGHFQTMIDSRCDCIGGGVTQYDGITYCYMFVGIPNSVNFYA